MYRGGTSRRLRRAISALRRPRPISTMRTAGSASSDRTDRAEATAAGDAALAARNKKSVRGYPSGTDPSGTDPSGAESKRLRSENATLRRDLEPLKQTHSPIRSEAHPSYLP